MHSILTFVDEILHFIDEMQINKKYFHQEKVIKSNLFRSIF